jgi:hypothetical protein
MPHDYEDKPPEPGPEPEDDGTEWPPPADDPAEEPSEAMAVDDEPDPDLSQNEP